MVQLGSEGVVQARIKIISYLGWVINIFDFSIQMYFSRFYAFEVDQSGTYSSFTEIYVSTDEIKNLGLYLYLSMKIIIY